MVCYFYPVGMVTKDIYREWILCEAEEIVTRIEIGYIQCDV